MASHTSELAPMTHRAGFLVEPGIAPVVCVEKIRSMSSRLQRRALGVTEFATERIVDLVVADQAIGHLRKIGTGER